MEIKRIPIIGLIGAAIGIQFAFHNNNLFVGFIIMIVCWGIAELIGIWIASILPEKYGHLINNSYWELFNLSLRLFGIVAIIAGLCFLGSLWYLFPNKNYIYTAEEQIILYIVSIFSLVIGVAFLVVKGYYPKEYNTTRTQEDETNK